MWEDIRIGDRVRHRQGGHVMVVEAFGGDEVIFCYWTEAGESRKGTFLKEDLEVVERPSLDDPSIRPGAGE